MGAIVKLKSLPDDERPREKLLAKGPARLADWELLAVLVGQGVKGRPVQLVVADILAHMDGNGGVPDLETLGCIKGVGPAKAAKIVAAFELVRRHLAPKKMRIRKSDDLLPLIRHYADRKQECFLCITLDGGHQVLNIRVVTIGLLNRTQVHPREVFSDAIADRAAAVIVAHNHPSGLVTPSVLDIEATHRLKEAGSILGIPLLDHLIFSYDAFFSFRQAGLFDLQGDFQAQQVSQ